MLLENSHRVGSPSRAGTVSFSHTGLRHLNFNRRPTLLRQPIDLTRLHRRLNLRLRADLRPRHVLNLFFHRVRHLIPLSTLDCHRRADSLHLRFNRHNRRAIDCGLDRRNRRLNRLIFHHGRHFDRRRRNRLRSLLSTLLFPVHGTLLCHTTARDTLHSPLANANGHITVSRALRHRVRVTHQRVRPLSLLVLSVSRFGHIGSDRNRDTNSRILGTITTSVGDRLHGISVIFHFNNRRFLVLLSGAPHRTTTVINRHLHFTTRTRRCLTSKRVVSLAIDLNYSALLPNRSTRDLLHHTSDTLCITGHRKHGHLTVTN